MKLTFRIPFVPVSKKNGQKRVLYKKNGNWIPGIRMNKRAEDQHKAISLVCQRAFDDCLPFPASLCDGTPFGTNEVAVTITRHVADECVTVEIEDLGPPPKGRTGRDRDTQNLADTICDALNGIAWEDDRQVRTITIRRMP